MTDIIPKKNTQRQMLKNRILSQTQATVIDELIIIDIQRNEKRKKGEAGT
jgi:hypothetical protein